MRSIRPLLVLAALAGLAAGLAAQSCVFYPSDTPATGAADPRPFGNGVPTHATYGTMRYQIQVPTAVLGTQPIDIREIHVAPAGSYTRSFADLQLRLGHNSNPITTQMVLNMPGFTSRPVQFTSITLPTVGDQWLPLGMAHEFHHDPALGMLVLEFFVRQASAAGGAGDVGFRTDPSIPFIWTSGSGYNGTAVAGGGIKLRFCTDTHGFIEYGSGGCTGSNGQRPLLTYAGSAQLGGTMQIQLANGPVVPNTIAVLVFSFVPRVGPFDLGVFGAPGCTAWVFGDVANWMTTGTGTQSVSLFLPPGLVPGFPIWNQWFLFDPPANAFGVTGSNFGRFMVGN